MGIERKTKMTELNFENDVAIDLDNLHEEWALHAHKRKAYADEVAFLSKQIKQQTKLIDVKKSQLKKEESRITIVIKSENPKATMQQIDAELILSTDTGLKTAQLAFSDEEDKKIEMEYNLNMAQNALKAMDDKKQALENEVVLWSRDYFATPREKREIMPGKQIQSIKQEIRDEKTQLSRTVVNERRRRRQE